MMLGGHALLLAGPVLVRGKQRPGSLNLSNSRQGMTPHFMGAGELTTVDTPATGGVSGQRDIPLVIDKVCH